MLTRLFCDVLVRPGDLEPTSEGFEVVGAFNPGAVATGAGDEVALLVRVAERPREKRSGFTALPRWDPEAGGAAIDWAANEDLNFLDPRVVEGKRDGRLRLTFISHLRAIRSPDGRSVGSFEGARFDPLMEGVDRKFWENEVFGVEDPRITAFSDGGDGRFYFTYVAVSPHGAATALASTLDFQTFERHGIIFPPENKDVVLFPEKIGGEYVAFHRPNPDSHFDRPEMWLARSKDLVDWGRHEPFQIGGEGQEWSSGRLGGGCPPLRVDEGWLVIYHGNMRPSEPGEVGAYCAGGLLLDAEDPSRVLARSAGPLLLPEEDFEREGFVPDVVFPTGLARRGDSILVYYGAADAATAVVEWSLAEILKSLE